MGPRLVFTTHYQVDEPAYAEFLIKLCTSAVQSSYKEVIAQKLINELNSRDKKLNEPASRYAVDLARELGLLTSNNVWTDKGFLVDLFAVINNLAWKEQLSLTTPERILHFRIFLEADGATLLYLANYILQNDCIPPDGITTNSFVEEMFIDILSNYLSVTTDIEKRVELRRKIDRIRTEGYHGHSGAHKLYIHVQTLYRVGIISKKKNSRNYCLPADAIEMKLGIINLLKKIPNVTSLEKLVNSHGLVDISADVLHIPYKKWEFENHEETVRILTNNYQQVMRTGVPLCPITTLIESMQISLLSIGILLKYNDGLNLITEIQTQNTRDIRFHVDRSGRPAFVRISDDIIRRFSN